jgi:hypothetical protein
MFLSDLPSPIAAFVSAARCGDGDAILSALRSVDVIVDGRREHRETEFRAWCERLGNESFVLRPVGARRRQGDIVVTVWVELDEDRRETESLMDFHFRMETGRLVQIRIGPSSCPRVPAPISDYIRAANSGDLMALLSTFAHDALVNDQLRNYWGKLEIEAWAARDIIGEHLTMRVVDSVHHYGHVIVEAHVDGTFDKRGLPDPLSMAFYFTAHGEKIVQLIILRNQSGT